MQFQFLKGHYCLSFAVLSIMEVKVMLNCVLNWVRNTVWHYFHFDFETFFLSYFIKFRILMLERGGVSCSTISPALPLVNLKVVSKTTKCRDFTVIFSVFFKNAP